MDPINWKKDIKIIAAIIGSLIVTVFLTNFVFIPKTPKVNQSFIKTLPNNINLLAGSLFVKLVSMRVPSPIPTVIPIKQITVMPTSAQPTTINQKIIPTLKPTSMPTKTPTAIVPTTKLNLPQPTKNPTIMPTKIIPDNSFNGCPKTSLQSYSSMRAERSNDDLVVDNPETSPEINLRLRGFGPNNKSTGFISRNGSTYGLDDKQPPQISTLFGGPRPQIVKTYSVYEWDFNNNKSAAPNPASPNYEVTMIGLGANPGQQLVGLQAGREIGGGNVFMVLYATDKDVVFTHSNSDTLMGGYLFFFLDICVDQNLLAKYNQDNNGGRNQLPVIAPGQIFGYAANTDIKVVVRDTMSFMDTRYNEDWWDYK